MSARIFLLCLLSLVISTVTPLKCQTCFGSEECTNGNMKLTECGANERYCRTVSFQSNTLNLSVNITSKRCAKECSQNDYSFTFLSEYLQFNEKCCETNGCNTAPLPNGDVQTQNGLSCPATYQHHGIFIEYNRPALCHGNEDQCIRVEFNLILLENYEDFQPNGLQCPGCFAPDEDSYEANQSVACVGKEDQCITLNLTTETEFFGNFTEKSTYQGCTTKNSCSFPLGHSEIAGGQIQFNTTTLECRNASSEPDHH